MLNVVAIMGRLVADPELRTTQSGTNVCSFRIACDRNFARQGEQRQAEGLEEDPAELGGEKAGERGARGVEDHGSLLRPQIVAP